ncbi:MAG: ABC transporter permease subunit [Limnochordales bacterium]|jgi:ABC-type proline/glycine betaine transport system, permease component|nr:choline ABC transporter permease subunit [Bacillota bacterium]
MFPEQLQVHIAPLIDELVDRILFEYGDVFDAFSGGILRWLLAIERGLRALPWWLVIAGAGVAARLLLRRWSASLALMALLFMVGMFGLWDLATETMAIIVAAVVLALLIGLPVGVAMAEFRGLRSVIVPVLDAMQTLPSFVYLIPAMMLFGLGKVPAVLATLIYSVPPVIRLTDLGLRQVPAGVQEAAAAFGANRWQLLWEVRLPLAVPSILAGVNQTTMMALAMVVVASMIGARGLGQEVLLSINRIEVGRGFEAGLSVVALAIVIDRLTQGFARRFEPPR